MRGYFEAQKKHLLEQVSDNNPEVEQRLKEAFGKALDAAFEDLEKNGVQPDSEERFWKNLSQTLSGCGCLRHGYRYFENVADKAYLALENQFRCWPPQELRAFLRENGLGSPQECRVLDVHIADNGRKELADILFDWQGIMALNYFFYRYGQLSEEGKKRFALAADAQNIVAEKDLINLTVNLDGICIMNDIRSKEELGRFLVENKLCFTSFNDETLPFLDYKKIAEKHMEETGGRLCCGIYVEDTVPQEKHIEIYDGVNLPDFTLAHEERQKTQGFGGGMAL